MFDLTKILPQYIYDALDPIDRQRFAKFYISVLIIAVLVGMILLFLTYLGKKSFFPSYDWTILEFGRWHSGVENCRLGEIVLTSFDAPEAYGKDAADSEDAKWIAGYANPNEAVWIPSETTDDRIVIGRGRSGDS